MENNQKIWYNMLEKVSYFFCVFMTHIYDSLVTVNGGRL